MSKNKGERQIDHKTSPIFVTKVDEDEGIVEAIVSVFGVIDYGRDVIHPGSFVKTITERTGSIRVLDQHNTDSILRVLGRPISLRELSRNELPSHVLEKFPEATGGLLTVTQYNMKTEAGREAFYRIAAGDVNEYSIGYEPLDFDYSEVTTAEGKVRVRNLRTIRLWEYGPVIWGMNPATTTVSAKQDSQKSGLTETSEFDGDGSTSRLDEGKAGRMLSSANAKRIRAAVDELVRVLKDAGAWDEEIGNEDQGEKSGNPLDAPSAGPDTEPPTDTVVQPDQLEALKMRAEIIDRRIVILQGEN